MKGLVRFDATADERRLLNRFHGIAVFGLYSVILALMLALAGCATQSRAPDQAPPVQVAESTWLQVDSDIGAASLAATEFAENYARLSLDDWRGRAVRHAEADFIPWFSGYWTQQWLSIKLAWYKLNAGEEKEAAVRRLAAYLQEQYQDLAGKIAENLAKSRPQPVKLEALSRDVTPSGE